MNQTATDRIFVVLNPAAGSGLAGAVRTNLAKHFPAGDGTDGPDPASCEVYETREGESTRDRIREAIATGARMVVAAGGDGTVSGVAAAMDKTDVPLAILPLGTANVLARELEIPVDVDAACALVAGEHAIRDIDGMCVDGRCYFTHLGVGIDAVMIRDTNREAKRRFGKLAYLWSASVHLLGFQPRNFTLTIDGKRHRFQASQVLVANIGVLGQPPFRWGPDILPDDGRLNVCIVRARNLADYLVVAWHFGRGQHKRSPNVRYVIAEREIIISTRHPLPVQADGEIIGDTPVTVACVPKALKIVVPVSPPAR